MKKLLVSSLVSLSTLMVGCQNPNLVAQQKMHDIDNTTGASIKPLPEFEEPVKVIYKPTDRRDPFYPPSLFSDIKNGGAAVVLNMNRKRQPLEKYNINSLTALGVLSKHGKPSALIQTPDGDVVVVSVGSYLGLDQGQIVHINKSNLLVMEFIPNGRGGFIKKNRTMTVFNNANEMDAKSTATNTP